ncbi:alpha/beta fold hydrolase [Saccharopolyspora erythraea]|uniref:alpha/beta fold hydrolase n=1 Tax=Saccharopolyspora erythraea TaxID=1836 RepID=UPI001BA8A0CF|nr:alpha/beta hydrolase [Saccharopolyspora erythraea]QUH01474.1 alpha/beta fold hydrolase [Saccharopolyspora erythraea]
MVADLVVRGGAVPIRVRDHDGEGAPVVLLHGAGGDLTAWDAFAPLLTHAHRVVAMDLRGHGESGDGPWNWDAVLDDIAAAVDGLGLENPHVVGHSLGGMLAGMWGRRRPGCPAVVSLDGHRSSVTEPRHYLGLPEEQVHLQLERLNALFSAQSSSLRRPGPEVASALREAPEFADCIPVFEQVGCPFLVVLAGRELPGLPAEFAELMAGYRAGLRRDLAALGERRPNVRVTEVEAGHGMVAEHPEAVAELVLDFLAASALAR